MRHQTDQLQAGWPRGRTKDVLTEGGRTAFFLSTKELQTLGIRQTHGLKRQKTHTRAVMAVIDGKMPLLRRYLAILLKSFKVFGIPEADYCFRFGLNKLSLKTSSVIFPLYVPEQLKST